MYCMSCDRLMSKSGMNCRGMMVWIMTRTHFLLCCSKNIFPTDVFLYYFPGLLATFFLHYTIVFLFSIKHRTDVCLSLLFFWPFSNILLRFFIVVLLCTIVFLFSIVFVANVVNKVCRVLKIFFIKNDDRTKKSDATSCQDMRFVEKDISKIELQLALYAISSEIVIMH